MVKKQYIRKGGGQLTDNPSNFSDPQNFIPFVPKPLENAQTKNDATGRDVTNLSLEERQNEALFGKKVNQIQQETNLKNIEAKAQATLVTPEQKQAQSQYAAENQQKSSQISDLLAPQPEKTIEQQRAEAGLATINGAVESAQNIATLGIVPALTNALGVQSAPLPSAFAQNPIAQKLLAPISSISTFNIPIVNRSLSTLFHDYGKNARTLRDDANHLVSIANVVSLRVKTGASPDDALEELNKIEASVQSKYNLAQQYLRKNPQDIVDGIDFNVDLAQALIKIQRRRETIQQYKITGDINRLNVDLGNLNAEDIYDNQQ